MIDEIDRKLILELQKDGRSSYSEIAQKLGLSVPTIQRRVQRLINDDVIKVTAVPNPLKVGHPTIGLLGINVDLTKVDEVCSKLVTYPYIHFAGICFGRFDIIAQVYVPSTEFLSEFIKNEVSHIDGVQKVETFYVTELKKRTYGWLSELEASPDVPAAKSKPQASKRRKTVKDKA